MAIPSILSGAAGRALDDVMRIRSYGASAGEVFDGVATGTRSSGSATKAVDELGESHDALRDVINGAKPGLRKALGPKGQEHLSSTLQADLAWIRAARSNLEGLGATATDVARRGQYGADGAKDLVQTIDDALPQLHSAARRTAAARVTLGALAAGSSLAAIGATGGQQALER